MLPAEELLKQAQSLNEAEKYAEVIELLKDELLEIYQNANLFAEKAEAYWRLKDKGLCYENAQKALLLEPGHTKANTYLGLFYWDINEYEKAEKHLKLAIKNDPNYPVPYNGLGNVHSETNQNIKAIECYNRAIELNPAYFYPYHNLGSVFHDMGQYEKAKEYLNKAIELNPDHSQSYFDLGLLYYDLKEYEKSKEYYNKFLDLTKNSQDYYTAIAKQKLIEIKKLTGSADYESISELVAKIRGILIFKDNCITHYTGLSVTKSLILESSLFRLSEGAFLNDTSEGRELFDYLPAFSATISTKINDTDAKLFAPKPFIGSFVAETKHDDLTLWRMYGKENKDEAKGCAITVDRDALLKNLKDSKTPFKSGTSEKIDEEFSFYKVAYRNHEKKEQFIIPGASLEDEDALNKALLDLSNKIKKLLKKKRNVTDIKNLIELLNGIAFLFKSSEYQYEHEVRLVVKGTGFEKKIDITSFPPKVFIELVSINPPISKITLGPKVERAEEWASAFYYSLDKQDLHPDILISHLPFK